MKISKKVLNTEFAGSSQSVNYGLVPGTRINEMRYMCDFGPTQFEEVRRAIAYIVDRDEINKQLTGGYGTVVDCYATDATADFAAIKDDIESELIHYSYDLDKAKQELIDGGWTLNEKGEEYKEGTDKYRYKEVDGELMKLKVEVACCEDDYSKLYNTVIPPEAEKIGMEYKYTSMDFALMINHLNRQGIDEPEYNIFYSSIGIPEILFYWNCFDDDPSLMGSWNVNYISDPELKAIGKEMQKVDPEDIDGFRKLYGKFQLAYNKKLPSLPMGSGVSYMFFNPKLKNFVPRAHVGWGAMVLDAYFEE